MTVKEQQAAAASFAAQWAGHGDEKQETSSFWLSLLQKVFGVADPTACIQFEVPVKLDHTSFIDAYLPATHVLIDIFNVRWLDLFLLLLTKSRALFAVFNFGCVYFC